jgi:hypothetical protein
VADYTVNSKRIPLFESAARTTTVVTTGTAAALRGPFTTLHLILDVTAAATDAGDTLDVTVQTRIADQWIDICAFTQVLGNGGAKIIVAKINGHSDQALFTHSALTAGNTRYLIGDALRAKHTIVDADADGSFTFSVYAVPQ